MKRYGNLIGNSPLLVVEDMWCNPGMLAVLSADNTGTAESSNQSLHDFLKLTNPAVNRPARIL